MGGEETKKGQQEEKVLEIDPLLKQDAFHKETATLMEGFIITASLRNSEKVATAEFDFL